LLFHPKGSRILTAIITICAILGAAFFVQPAAATIVKIAVPTSARGSLNDFDFLTAFPQAVTFSVGSSSPGSTFLWQLGDGTNSTDPSPTHSYGAPCVYVVRVRVTSSNGSVTSGGVVVGAFDAKGQPGGALAVCPPQGTAGFVPVELAGGYFPPNQAVSVTMDGASIGAVTADRGGNWVLNVTGFITPRPSGAVYAFATSPPSLTRTFATLEGIRASPSSGAPGDSVVVVGRSYPAYGTVSVLLGGASLGDAQTDGNGSFSAGFQIPVVSPLTVAGTYPYTTLPAIQGSQANFTSAGATISETVFSWWWLFLILLIILVIIFVILIWRRGRRRVEPQT